MSTHYFSQSGLILKAKRAFNQCTVFGLLIYFFAKYVKFVGYIAAAVLQYYIQCHYQSH